MAKCRNCGWDNAKVLPAGALSCCPESDYRSEMEVRKMVEIEEAHVALDFLKDGVRGRGSLVTRIHDVAKTFRTLVRNLCHEQDVALPCDNYERSGAGAGVEADGKSECANCGHPELFHGPELDELPEWDASQCSCHLSPPCNYCSSGEYKA